MTDSPLRILLMAAEMVPFAKTGGLADVTGALPKALKMQGHDVRVAMPRYGRIDRERFQVGEALASYPVPMDDHSEDAALLHAVVTSAGGDVPVYMIDNAHYYDRDGIYMYEDDADRFIFFCRATLEGIKRVGWQPDVIHCHDWHTAIVPNWLKTIYKDDPFYTNTACVYTIHNLAYQGVFGYRVLEIAGVDEFGFIAHPDTPALNDVVDFMGRGIYYADIINTVSETYANEILMPEFGEGLDPLLRDRRDRLYGVLNGIDTEINNPATDQFLVKRYDIGNLAGKVECKLDLQREAGLPQSRTTPLIGIISRLAVPQADRDVPNLQRSDFAEDLRWLGYVSHALALRAERPEPDDRPALRLHPDRARNRWPGRHSAQLRPNHRRGQRLLIPALRLDGAVCGDHPRARELSLSQHLATAHATSHVGRSLLGDLGPALYRAVSPCDRHAHRAAAA